MEVYMPSKKKDIVFNYVVARPWDPANPAGSMCIYASGSEVQRGTLKDAKGFLEYVKRQEKQDEEPKDIVSSYGVYAVGFTKIV
jgi:hypothetical protein